MWYVILNSSSRKSYFSFFFLPLQFYKYLTFFLTIHRHLLSTIKAINVLKTWNLCFTLWPAWYTGCMTTASIDVCVPNSIYLVFFFTIIQASVSVCVTCVLITRSNCFYDCASSQCICALKLWKSGKGANFLGILVIATLIAPPTMALGRGYRRRESS